ncbi:activating signal cointegrator 1-like [Ornithodoros turicata]|uniref:activating signal cointegrator 1-like n=1 Tax=Ornithodoros turicata TaxID=34597 RepID=UPI003138EBDA
MDKDIHAAPVKVYKKAELPDHVQQKSKSKTSKKKILSSSQVGTASPPDQLADTSSSSSNSSIALTPQAAKRKQRFVNLYSKEGRERDTILLPGRHPCQCQASRHALINNCLKCGRIVCQQEGSGPCFTCGALVCTQEEKDILSRDSRKSQQLRDKLLSDANNENFLKAVAHKNKLLEYNRTSAQRTKVIDDDSDYFSTENMWLTPEQRDQVRRREAEMRAEREKSRRTQRITFDLAGRRVVTEEEEERNVQAMFENMFLQDVHSQGDLEAVHFVDPAISIEAPEYIDTGGFQGRKSRYETTQESLLTMGRDGVLLGSRVQDRSLMQMSDDGFALSIHQPYASLIVANIKKHEGRSWFTSYRGRLWIHAGARQPSQEDVTEVLDYYKSATKGQDVKFPEEYPTGCLLGCVDLVDCVPQDEYREQFPMGECFSPYVFICDSPQELKIKFPMKGKHKIFKIDTKLHQASTKLLLCPQLMKCQ